MNHILTKNTLNLRTIIVIMVFLLCILIIDFITVSFLDTYQVYINPNIKQYIVLFSFVVFAKFAFLYKFVIQFLIYILLDKRQMFYVWYLWFHNSLQLFWCAEYMNIFWRNISNIDFTTFFKQKIVKRRNILFTVH